MLSNVKCVGISRSMVNTVGSYMSKRTFRVKGGSAVSRLHVQENGVPQGGVLSCTIYSQDKLPEEVTSINFSLHIRGRRSNVF